MGKFISVLLAFISAIFIICAAVTFTLNFRPLYETDIDNYSLTETTGLSRDEILANYQSMIKYNNIGGPDTLEFPDFSMSKNGRIHFEEVRVIFFAIEYAMIICGIITVFAVILAVRKKWHIYRLMTGIFTIALPSAAGIMAVFSWDGLFVLFHRIMFNNDYWIFDSSADPVITILPDGYFLHCLILIVIIAFAAAAGFFMWYRYAKKSV